jgi:hypothetical protein
MKEQKLCPTLYAVDVEEDGRVKKLELEEDEICWEGFRKVAGRMIRGVPRRTSKDCSRYCTQEGCDLL